MNEEEARNASRRKQKESNVLYLSSRNKATTFSWSEKKLLGVVNKVGSEKAIFLLSFIV